MTPILTVPLGWMTVSTIFFQGSIFGGGRAITMDGLVATPQAFLATGAYLAPDGNVAVHVWRSTNGADWVRLPHSRSQSGTPAEQLLPRDIAAGAAGYLCIPTATTSPP